MIKKRSFVVLIIIMISLITLIARLMQIQLISTESFSKENINLIEASVSQRTQEMVIDQGRGKFVDRNGDSLTHEIYPSLVLFPFLGEMDWPVEEIAKIINVSTTTLENAVTNANKPFAYGGEQPLKLTETQVNEINGLQIPGVFAVNRQYELDTKNAEHLIGLLRENEELLKERYPEKEQLSPRTPLGITGLQAAFDEFLLPEGEAKLLYHVDGDGGPLFGIDVKYIAPANPFYPVAIKTTLDKEIQLLAEQVIGKYNMKKGGLVLLDIENNDIVAMVSVPEIDQSDPFGDASAQNQMLLPQFPGSVFKTVIAAATIESNLPTANRSFDCSLDLYGNRAKEYNYGPLSFTESFARSCNYTFATLAQELIEINPDIIEKYADKLGLLQQVGWSGDVFHFKDFRQLPEEYSGQIWGDEKDKFVLKAIAQTAIGQKEVRITPLAIANMMATIARGGEKKEVRAVQEILYKSGTTLYSFSEQTLNDDTIAPYTAIILQQLLREVVKNEKGTGRRFQTLPYEVAGKSGTAETGKTNENGVPLVNKWFAGYFPVTEPRYALVVVDLDQVSSKSVTNDVYYDFVNQLYQLEKQK